MVISKKNEKPHTINKISDKKFVEPHVTFLKNNPPKTISAGKRIFWADTLERGIPFFTNFGTEQGLALNSVLCSLTDKAGNLWFGTAGGGVSRYDGKNFTNYTITQGLPSNVVFSIIEDNNQNVWLGTSAGVSKYDGYSFKNYTINDGLAGNFISSIVKDTNGNLWFGTHEGGVTKCDGKTFTTYDKKNGLPDNYIQGMLADKNGSIWLTTSRGWVINFNGYDFKNYSKLEGLQNNFVNNIFQDKKGSLWFITKTGVCKFDGTKLSELTTPQGLVDNAISCMAEDDGGNLWFGTQNGSVSRYDGKSFTNYKGIFGSNNLTSISKDKEGNLWFTSLGGGISKYEDNKLTSYTLPNRFTGNVFSIFKDKTGALWLGTQEAGANKFDGRKFINIMSAQGLPDDWVWNIMQDNAGNIWFATDKGGVSKYDGKNFINYKAGQGLANNTVTCIFQDKKGDIWFGTFGGASRFDGKSIFTYTTKQGLPGNNVLNITEDKSGNIWFGTHDNGVSRFDGQYFTNYTTNDGLASNTVYAALKDKNGNIWFGTNKGVSEYDGENFINYTKDDGLPDDNVWNLGEDSVRNIIWFGTNSGLAALKEFPSKNNPFHSSIEVFNEKSGYPIKEINSGAMLVDHDGELWLGSGQNALIRFDYPNLKKKNPPELNLKIQSIKVNNESVCWNDLRNKREDSGNTDSLVLLNEMTTSFGKVLPPLVLDSMAKKFKGISFDSISKFYPVPVNLVLPYNDNTITIDFAAIAPALAGKIQYRWKLENYSKAWSPWSTTSFANFGNIQPGNYIFKLESVSPSGIHGETKYHFKVLSPWWTSWWANIVYALTAGGLLYAIFRNRIRTIERKQTAQINIMVATREEERQRIARDLHDEVGVKLSALKLYLSSLSEKALSIHNHEITSISQHSENLVSEAMQDVRRLLLNLSPGILEEFGFCAAVEGLVNKINESGRVQMNLNIFGMKKRLQRDYELALYRITQELINNILKHANAKKVTLQIGQRDEKIVVMIEDDGKGFDINNHSVGQGLHNLKIRTQAMKGTMNLDSQPGRGTTVLIEIPYNKNVA